MRLCETVSQLADSYRKQDFLLRSFHQNFSKQDRPSTVKKPFPSGSKRPLCVFCGLYGHTVDKCHRKHGFPPGYRNRIQTDKVNQVGDCSLSNIDNLITDSTQVPMFTKEQYDNLVHLLQERNVSGVAQVPVHDSSVNALSSFVPVKDSGSTGLVFNCIGSSVNNSWILDSGATDHIVSDVRFFEDLTPVDKKFVKLPDNTLVKVVSIDGKTPFETLFQTVPKTNHLRIFGCLAYAFVLPKPQTKMHPRDVLFSKDIFPFKVVQKCASYKEVVLPAHDNNSSLDDLDIGIHCLNANNDGSQHESMLQHESVLQHEIVLPQDSSVEAGNEPAADGCDNSLQASVETSTDNQHQVNSFPSVAYVMGQHPHPLKS
ncbi:hypothetical protein GQ457_14G011310 [Hibiscus cannabinus]